MGTSFGRAALFMLLALGAACGGDVTVVDDDGSGGSSSPKGPATGGSSSDGAASPDGSNGSGTNGQNGNGNGPNGSGPNGAGGSSGQSGSSSGAGGAQQVCDDFGTPCTACVAEACPSDWCACAENADCPALFGCTNMCNGDPACNQQCLQDHEGGISAAYLVSSCAGGPCSGSCPQGGEPLQPCGTCLFQSCDQVMNACIVEPDCMPLWNCLIDCPQLDLACQDGCYDTFGDGVDALQPVLDCATANCQPVCGDD